MQVAEMTVRTGGKPAWSRCGSKRPDRGGRHGHHGSDGERFGDAEAKTTTEHDPLVVHPHAVAAVILGALLQVSLRNFVSRQAPVAGRGDRLNLATQSEVAQVAKRGAENI